MLGGLLFSGIALVVGLALLDRPGATTSVAAPSQVSGFAQGSSLLRKTDLAAPTGTEQRGQHGPVGEEVAPSTATEAAPVAPDGVAQALAPTDAQGRTRASLHGTITVADPRLGNKSFYVNLFGPLAAGVPEKRPLKRVRGKDSYEMKDIQPGQYHLVLSATSGGVRLAEREIVLAPGDNMQDLFVESLPVEDCLVVRAQGPDGEPTYPKDLFWQRVGEGGRVHWQRAAQTSLGDAAWLIPAPKEWRDGFALGAQLPMLSAAHQDFSDVLVPVAAGTREVMVQFGEAVRLELSLTNLPATLAEHIQIMIQRVEGPPGTGKTRTKAPEALGRYVLDHVETGINQVLVFNQRNGILDRSLICKATIEVVPGTNTAVIAVPDLHDVSVAVPEGRPGRKVRITRISEQAKGSKRPERFKEPVYVVGSEKLDEHSRALMQNVPAGTYKVSCGRLSDEITVPCGVFVLR